jgi:hypothetical protein
VAEHARGDAGLLDLAVAAEHAGHPAQVDLVGALVHVAEHHRAVGGVVADRVDDRAPSSSMCEFSTSSAGTA